MKGILMSTQPTLLRPFFGVLLGFLFIGSTLHAADLAAFEQRFDHLKPGQALTGKNTPNLQAVFGTAKVFFDKGGKGITPAVQLFEGDKPVAFLNLSGAQVATANPYADAFDLILVFTGRTAQPANPFGSSAHMQLQVQLRQSKPDAADGLSMRFYGNGKVEVWNGEVGKSKPRMIGGLGIDRNGAYELVIRHTPNSVTFLVDGEEKATFNSAFAAENAGYVSFGRGGARDYNAVKIQSVSMRKIGDRSELAQPIVKKKS
jgi:hypothetical protein